MMQQQTFFDPFFYYPQSSFQSSIGPVELPIMYYDASEFVAFYRVEQEKLQGLLPQELEPVVSLDGKVMVIMAFYSYRKSSIGPYKESSVAIMAKPKFFSDPVSIMNVFKPLDQRLSGFYIVDLPVTTEEANVAGREIWNYPKFVTEIDFRMKDNEFEGLLRDPDNENDFILRMSGKTGFSVPGPLPGIVLYSQQQDRILRAHVNLKGPAKWSSPGSMRLSLSQTCRHPMAERVRKLGLEGRKPAVICSCPYLQLRLNAGAVLKEPLH